MHIPTSYTELLKSNYTNYFKQISGVNSHKQNYILRPNVDKVSENKKKTYEYAKKFRISLSNRLRLSL